ncbi:MAG: hypothetical protein H0W61_17865 [Bacteroidetes bacterium]|nr:hypothetical protein [Bacteroidota bacterium]
MYKWFYNKISSKGSVADDSIHLLTEKEITYIKRRENITIFLAALIGAIMVLVLYLPQYWWPHLFPVNRFHVPFIKDTVEFSVSAFLYGMLLVYAEIVLLTFLNIYCAHEIAFATGFINHQTKFTTEKKQLLLTIGQEKKTKDIKQFGIDPYSGLSKGSVFLMNLFFTLKATLSNLLFKIFVQRVLGRYAIREVLDMVGIPIFAFWNAWGTRKVLREARIIIMGQTYLEHFKGDLSQFRKLNGSEKILLYDTLQYVAISKRDYHKNHYYLTKLVLEQFEIALEKNHIISPDYAQRLNACAEDFKKLNEKIMLIGFVLDGSFSVREKARLKALNKNNVITKKAEDVEMLAANFIYGHGLSDQKL